MDCVQHFGMPTLSIIQRKIGLQSFSYYRNTVLFASSGQSYKQVMLIIYDSRVVIWSIFKSGTTLES